MSTVIILGMDWVSPSCYTGSFGGLVNIATDMEGPPWRLKEHFVDRTQEYTGILHFRTHHLCITNPGFKFYYRATVL